MTKAQTKTSSEGQIRSWREGPLRWISIENEARRNALNRAMWQALSETIAEAEGDHETHVIVLRGAGTRAFSAGADISEFGDERTGALRPRPMTRSTSKPSMRFGIAQSQRWR